LIGKVTDKKVDCLVCFVRLAIILLESEVMAR